MTTQLQNDLIKKDNIKTFLNKKNVNYINEDINNNESYLNLMRVADVAPKDNKFDQDNNYDKIDDNKQSILEKFLDQVIDLVQQKISNDQIQHQSQLMQRLQNTSNIQEPVNYLSDLLMQNGEKDNLISKQDIENLKLLKHNVDDITKSNNGKEPFVMNDLYNKTKEVTDNQLKNNILQNNDNNQNIKNDNDINYPDMNYTKKLAELQGHIQQLLSGGGNIFYLIMIVFADLADVVELQIRKKGADIDKNSKNNLFLQNYESALQELQRLKDNPLIKKYILDKSGDKDHIKLSDIINLLHGKAADGSDVSPDDLKKIKNDLSSFNECFSDVKDDDGKPLFHENMTGDDVQKLFDQKIKDLNKVVKEIDSGLSPLNPPNYMDNSKGDVDVKDFSTWLDPEKKKIENASNTAATVDKKFNSTMQQYSGLMNGYYAGIASAGTDSKTAINKLFP